MTVPATPAPVPDGLPHASVNGTDAHAATTVLPAVPDAAIGGAARHDRPPGRGLAEIEAREITAWFGTHKVLDRVSLTMRAGRSPR